MKQLISDEYLEQQKKIHSDNKNYGTSSKRWVQHVLDLSGELNTRDILDYGCGKGVLQQNLPFSIKQYDPAIYVHSKRPKPADLVVCTDVLEHVEPECIESVIEHLNDVTKRCLFVVIHGNEAQKTLEDGRNAHLIIEDGAWWFSKLSVCFTINSYMRNFNKDGEQEYIILAQPTKG